MAIPTRKTGGLALHAPLFQLLGYHRTVAKDLDPDDPQHLSQVVTF